MPFSEKYERLELLLNEVACWSNRSESKMW